MGVETGGDAHWLGNHAGSQTKRGAVKLSLPVSGPERKQTIRTIADAIASDVVPIVDIPVVRGFRATELERLPIAISTTSAPSSDEVGPYTPLGAIDIIHPDDGGVHGLLGIHHNPILGFVGFLHNRNGDVLFTDDHRLGEEAAYVLAVMSGINAAREALNQNVAYGLIQARSREMNHAMSVLTNAMKIGIEPHHKIIRLLEEGRLSDQTVHEWSQEIMRWEHDQEQAQAILVAREHERYEHTESMPPGLDSNFTFQNGFIQPAQHWKRTLVIPVGANNDFESWEEEGGLRGGSHGRGTIITVHEEFETGESSIFIESSHRFRRK